MEEWIKKMIQLQVDYKRFTLGLRRRRVNVKRWRKKFPANSNPKRAEVSILTSDKIDVK